MMPLNKYSRFVSRASRGVAYWSRVAMRDFTEDLLARMGILKMNNAALAEAAGVTPAYITKVLRGSENFTLDTMSKLAMAVGGKVRIHIADQQATTYWIDSIGVKPPLTQPSTQALSFFDIGQSRKPMRTLHVLGTRGSAAPEARAN